MIILKMFVEQEVGFGGRSCLITSCTRTWSAESVQALQDVLLIVQQWHAGPENDCITESVHSMQGPDDFAFWAKFLNGLPCQNAKVA